MNFEALKTGFFSYLEEKLGGEDKKPEQLQDSAISVFMYSSEFKDYLVEEVGADASIFSKSINEIMKMDFVNGKLVEPEEESGDTFETEDGVSGEEAPENSDFMTNIMNEFFADENVISTLDSDASGDLNIDEVNAFYQNISADNETGEITFDDMAMSFQNIMNGEYEPEEPTESSGNIINRLLDKVYSNKTVIKTLDEDGDGALSDEEKAKFEEYIKGYDGDSEGELSESDIKRAFDDIIDGKFSYDNDLKDLSKEIDEKVETELADKSKETQTSAPSTGNRNVGGSSGGGGNVGSSNSFSNSNASGPKTIENMTLEELQAEQKTQEQEVSTARDEINDVHSGENSAVKAAKEDYDEAKEAYDKAVENDENISDDLKQKRDDNLSAIEAKETEIDELNVNINDQESVISEQETTLSADESNLGALESALSALPSTSEDPEKQSEIDSKRKELESAISDAKEKVKADKDAIDKSKEKLKEMQDNLKKAEDALADLEDERAEIEAEIEKVCGPETKEALKAFNEAKENVDTVKNQELDAAQSKLDTAQAKLDEINAQINVKQSEKTEKENSVSDFDFDFDLNLSDRQKGELEAFKKNWEQNKDKYEAVEKATGMPAELIASIHWREGSGNFDTYLHNGQKLGQVTTAVPKGIYFEDWTTAAIDAVTNYGSDLSSIDPNDINTYYNYAEHYNGMGYHNKGLPSPYVWAGTSNYQSGKYVADGKFDPNYVDQQLGVAVMLQALMS